MPKRKKIHSSRCTCGKVAFYSEEAAEFHLRQAQRLSFLNTDRKECRVYKCPGTRLGDVWHLTSMTLAKFDHRTRVWVRAAVWTYGVRGMPSIVLTPRQMKGRVSTSPWRTKAVVRVIVRKRKTERN